MDDLPNKSYLVSKNKTMKSLNSDCFHVNPLHHS